MPKPVPIQAVNQEGHVVHSFKSISQAAGAGFCAASISMSLNHGRTVEGLNWRRVGKAPITIDRLEALAARLEAVAERLSK
jgi:hypothetical protein